MRNSPLKGMLKASPTKKNYDFTKKTRDLSPEATKGNIGSKIANIVTPKSKAGLLTAALPIDKVVKAGKSVYNYFSSKDKA